MIEQIQRKSTGNPKFNKALGKAFSKTLRERVNAHFKTSGVSRHANSSMYTKTVFMLTLFFGPFLIMGVGGITSPALLFVLYIVSGLGMAGIGMGVMHDAIHGSYSKNTKVNKIMSYTFNLIGGNADVWKIQHNTLHHTFTNIEHADDDLNAPFFLRFSPHAEKYWTHQYQHIYIWFFYALSTLSWIVTKDFIRIKRYHGMGFVNKKNEYRNTVIEMFGWKLLYYSYALVIPLVFVPQAWWVIFLAFVTMHFVTGLIISSVFQVAHITPDVKYPLPDADGLIASDWYTHQLATTTNFSPRSRLFSWLIGGLNYQVEHHLLPDICHIHYKELSKIVAYTAEEYGLPYNTKSTFRAAISSHTTMLKELGNA